MVSETRLILFDEIGESILPNEVPDKGAPFLATPPGSLFLPGVHLCGCAAPFVARTIIVRAVSSTLLAHYRQ